mgnify:CR=1 FL=1
MAKLRTLIGKAVTYVYTQWDNMMHHRAHAHNIKVL